MSYSGVSGFKGTPKVPLKNSNTQNMKKWWQLNLSRDEVDFFNIIARNPDYDWRKIPSVIKELKWNMEKFIKIVKPFVQNGMILVKKTKDGERIGYWERVGTKQDLLDSVQENQKTVVSGVSGYVGTSGGSHYGNAVPAPPPASATGGITQAP